MLLAIVRHPLVFVDILLQSVRRLLELLLQRFLPETPDGASVRALRGGLEKPWGQKSWGHILFLAQ